MFLFNFRNKKIQISATTIRKNNQLYENLSKKHPRKKEGFQETPFRTKTIRTKNLALLVTPDTHLNLPRHFKLGHVQPVSHSRQIPVVIFPNKNILIHK